MVTLVHPDLLPPVYASALTLRDNGYRISIVCVDSTVTSYIDLGDNIQLITCGKYMGQPFAQRNKVRNEIYQAVKKAYTPDTIAIISFCAFSYLLSLKFKQQLPALFIALEVENYSWTELKRSPITTYRNWRSIRKIKEASLVATPSIQRSAWLAGRANMDKMPVTIQNSAYIQPMDKNTQLFRKVVPAHFADKTIMLYTGAVNSTLGVFDLVKGFDQLADPGCALIITRVGEDAYSNEIKKFVAASAWKDNILLLPNLPREQMLAIQCNANIGVTFVRETASDIKTQMLAPNKVGEYLASGLFLVGSNVVYMQQFKDAGIAALAESLSPVDIAGALKAAKSRMDKPGTAESIIDFTRNTFSMQQQLKPVINFLQQLN